MEKRTKSFGTMLTPGHSNYESKNSECDVLTFNPEERPDIIEKLKQISFDDLEQKEDYVTINWSEFECITVLLKDDAVLGFSSVWHRPEYYEKGEVRILNRYWEDASLRKPGREIVRPHLLATIKHQLEIAKQLGFTKAFISRCRNRLYMKKLFLEIEKKTGTKWQFSDDKVLVCRKENPRCWQYKGTHDIKKET
jgi:hypothetical protein